MPSFGVSGFLQLIVQQLGLGMIAGLVLGAAAMYIFARLPKTIGAFAPVASVAAFALTFGITISLVVVDSWQSTWWAWLSVVRRLGIVAKLLTFHEGLAFIAQVTMFVVLGLLVVLMHSWLLLCQALSSPSC